MDISTFDYSLPEELIATKPADPRDSSRLMLINRRNETIAHRHFCELSDLLDKDTVLVFNQTKVFPARLFGKKETGGKVELLLLESINENTWKAISKPGLKPGQIVHLAADLSGKVVEVEEEGIISLEFNLGGEVLLSKIQDLGLVPLPPYIKSTESEEKLREEYQTVYAKHIGSSAAPTAGLHFTKELMKELKDQGVGLEYITLHVGLGTFKPVGEAQIQSKALHQERYLIDSETAKRLNQAKAEGKRIIAVGTTSARTLESSALLGEGELLSGSHSTRLFIYPPFKFQFIEGLLTNFHLPQSSLLMLVSALVSAPNTAKEFKGFPGSLIGRAYQEAVKEKYRFFSFGDASLII